MLPSPDLPPQPPERALLARLTAGDHVAFEILVRTYLSELLQYAGRIVQSPEVAQDIVQDVFCWLWDNHATLTVRGTVREYLFGAVRHRALNALRDAHAAAQREARYARDDADEEAATGMDDPDAQVEQQELTAAVSRAIEQLPPRRRQIVLLRWRQLTYAEIAEVMGISVKTVEAQITSAYQTLRSTLGVWVK